MRKLIDLKGKKFGRLTVIKRVENRGNDIYWLCKCDCGNTKTIFGGSLKRGLTKSCGCLAKEIRAKAITKHGMAKARLDNIFYGMKARCYNVKEPAYKWYGARGIKICKEWLDDKKTFFEWAMLNGYKDNLTIDRIDVNGNYEPSNCRWITNNKQCRNRRSNHLITYKNETLTLKEWSEKLGFSYSALCSRIKRGWSIEKTFTTPLMLNAYAFKNDL
jgi:hypothetical protein